MDVLKSMKLGMVLEHITWNGKIEYFTVVDFAVAPTCKFAEGETYIDYTNGDKMPMGQPIFKNGSAKKLPAVRLDCWAECKVISGK